MAMAGDAAAVRDRVLLLLGYASAFRRSELVALDVEDLKFTTAGLYVWIRAAKNDPRTKGRELYVPRLDEEDVVRRHWFIRSFTGAHQRGETAERTHRTEKTTHGSS
jgi:integrase